MPRPAGPLIWIHFPVYEGPAAILPILTRAQEEIGRLNAIVTFDRIAEGSESSEEIAEFLLRPAPPENRTEAGQFLKHWRPDILIWVGGPFRPVLLNAVDGNGVPRILVNAKADALTSVTGTWVPGMSRALVGPFRNVLTSDDTAAQRLVRMGIDPASLEVVGTLDDDPEPPTCDDHRRGRLAEILGARPRWMAAQVPLEEIASLIRAHRVAQRRAHRLLLILAPADRQSGIAIRDRLHEDGMRCALRSAGEDPDDDTEIVVADRSEELGLWLRLAPVAYLGGTIAGSRPLHPYHPAALGAAIVHGGRIVAHQRQFDRLASAGATRAVSGAEELGRTVETLLPPNQAARMAHAGWTVIAANAALSNRLTEIIIDVLDESAAAGTPA